MHSQSRKTVAKRRHMYIVHTALCNEGGSSDEAVGEPAQAGCALLAGLSRLPEPARGLRLTVTIDFRTAQRPSAGILP